MAKSINDKLKEVVEQKLAKAKQPKKKKTKEEKPSYEETLVALGIPQPKTRVPEVDVYKFKYHNRARLDHTKYPTERSHYMENSPMFATYEEADKYRKKLEKEDPENFYSPTLTSVKVTEVDAKLMKKLKARGWGFHG